jgi:hypothetical protein
MTHPLSDYFDSLLGVTDWDSRLEKAVAPFAEPVVAQDSILPGKRLQLSQPAEQQPVSANYAMALNMLTLLATLSSSRLRMAMLVYCQRYLSQLRRATSAMGDWHG